MPWLPDWRIEELAMSKGVRLTAKQVREASVDINGRGRVYTTTPGGPEVERVLLREKHGPSNE